MKLYEDESSFPQVILIFNFPFFLLSGLFNVPHVAHCYLLNGTFLKNFTPKYIDPSIDPDVKFCQTLRDAVREIYSFNKEILLEFLFRVILFIYIMKLIMDI